MSAYEATILSKKPVGYWRLGEKSGSRNALDTSTNGHIGIYQGSVVFGESGAISGDLDSAIRLNGTDAYVEIPNHKDFSQPTSQQGLSVEAWVRLSTFDFEGEDPKNSYMHWLSKGDSGKQEWALRIHNQTSETPHKIAAYIFNSAGGLGAGAYFIEETLSDGNSDWIHIVACFDPGDASNENAGVSIYRNGELKKGPKERGTLYNNPGCWTINPVAGDAPLRIGTRGQKKFFAGGLDEVAIYARVLRADEVIDNYKTGIG
jgi:Concanavalin A-like lectin/glucanases superfamily